MIRIKFTFALLTLLPISSAAPAERTELSVVAGDTPRSVRITGPKSLTDLGKGKYGKWVGCGYKDAGTYRIVTKTFHPALNDALMDDWIGEARFVAK